MIGINSGTVGVQNIISEHLENVTSTVASEVYQMVKSLGYKGEIHEFIKIQNWLDSTGYTMESSSMKHSGVSIIQYSIKKNEKVLRSVLVRNFYKDGQLKVQISKEDYTNSEFIK